MKILNYTNITYPYDFDRSIILRLAYDVAYSKEPHEKRRVFFSGNRSLPLKIKPGTDVYIVIVDKDDNLLVIEPLTFDEKGNAKVSDVLDKHGISWRPVDKKKYDHFKSGLEHCWHYYEGIITMSENGYYLESSYWTDYNLFVGSVTLRLKNGPVKDGKKLILLTISGTEDPDTYWKVDESVIDFIEKMLEQGCTLEEYESFMAEQKKHYRTYEEFV